MRLRLLPVALALLSLAGCRDDDSELELSVFSSGGYDWSRLVVEVRGPGLHSTVRREHFLPVSAAPDQFRGPVLRFTGSGTARVNVALPAASGSAGIGTSLDFPVERQWKYGVSLWLGRLRPMSICGSVTAALPLAGTSDSLFVMQGGRPRDAVC